VKQLKAAVLGASGYTGGELLRILARHPYVELGPVFAQSSAGVLVSDLHPWAEEDMVFEATNGSEIDAEICFLALPHGEAMSIAPALLEQGKIVIDLSGDHRLKDGALYQQYYKKAPAETVVVNEAIYGLPEWNKEAIQSARFVSNPGCYATSAILALAAPLAEGLIDPKSIVINSMSGVSGAGRKSSVEYSFVEVNENVKAYRIGDHQHIPEIESVLSGIASQEVKVTFTPHLIPITRGIYTTINAQLANGATHDAFAAAFDKYYANAPFVRVSATRIPEIRRVTGTNFIDIYFQVLPDRDQVTIISTEDNLVKGAAGQAVQNMNLLCGFPETEGLL